VAGLSLVQSAAPNAVKVIGKAVAPTGVTATGGVGKATLRLVAPTNNGGGTITGYVVTVYVAAGLQETVTFTTPVLTETITASRARPASRLAVNAASAASRSPNCRSA